MKNRKLVVVAIVAAGALAALGLFMNWSSGPSYGGKSAAQWLKMYRTASLAEKEDAIDAFKASGDRAVPYLISVLIRPDRLPLLRTYGRLWSKLPQPLQKLLPGVSTEEIDSRAAYELLRAIRPSAKVMMPRLKPWLASPEHPLYLEALNVLGVVGDGGSEGVPFLVDALQSTNRYHRIFAVQSLHALGPEARTAVPALINALGDSATGQRAIRALGNIGPEAKDAVPHLERALATKDYAAAVALHKINPEGNGLRLLMEATADSRTRSAAMSWIGELGPVAMPALDLLLEALRTEGRTNRAGGPEWASVAAAVRRISPTNRTAIAILLQKLENAQGLDRLNLATELVRFDSAELHGLKVLAETLRSDREPGSRGFAAYVLRQAGPGARSAIPALKGALNDKDKTVRASAASALKKIELSTAE